VEGAVFAQFNLDTPSYDLINADYTIGIPATYRFGDNSLRFRIYHQSSHLGDEFLQSVNPPKQVNLSYEAIELIYSRGWRRWRVYGGGEHLIHKEPGDLKPMSTHWPSISASRLASSSVIPTQGSVACALWPSGRRGLICAASFTTIRLNTVAWGCRWDSDGVCRGEF
jgi:hypothetical protein